MNDVAVLCKSTEPPIAMKTEPTEGAWNKSLTTILKKSMIWRSVRTDAKSIRAFTIMSNAAKMKIRETKMNEVAGLCNEHRAADGDEDRANGLHQDEGVGGWPS